LLRELPIDQGLGDWRHPDIGTDERVAPGRRAVPDVLGGGVVVERDPVDEVRHADGFEGAVIGKAQIRIVDPDRVGGRIPRQLQKCP